MNGNGNLERLADSVETIAEWGRPSQGRPPAVPPSCFSELYRLNQCYDDIQAMREILTKVMTDLIKGDPAIAEAIIEAIKASGSDVPLIGVTDGSDAQPGQVGEFLQFTVNGTAPNASGGWAVQNISAGVLPPGDWDVNAAFNPQVGTAGAYLRLEPQPAGFSNNMNGGFYVPATAPPIANWMVTQTARAALAVPTLLAWLVNVETVQDTPWILMIEARRAR